MPGLAGYLLAGAAVGAGDAITQRAQNLYEQAMKDQEWQQRVAIQEREYDLRDQNNANSKARTKGAAGRPASGNTQLVGEVIGDDGILYGRVKNGTEVKPYLDENGEPFRTRGPYNPKTKQYDSYTGSDVAPNVQTEITGPSQRSPMGPSVGEVVEGHEFLGGNPNDPNSWKKAY